MTPLRDRPTPDLIVIWLAGIVGAVVIGTLLIATLVVIRNPEANINDELAFVADMTAALMTGVIGYIGGRATKDPPENPPKENRPR
jgi:hypothetical protein